MYENIKFVGRFVPNDGAKTLRGVHTTTDQDANGLSSASTHKQLESATANGGAHRCVELS